MLSSPTGNQNNRNWQKEGGKARSQIPVIPKERIKGARRRISSGISTENSGVGGGPQPVGNAQWVLSKIFLAPASCLLADRRNFRTTQTHFTTVWSNHLCESLYTVSATYTPYIIRLAVFQPAFRIFLDIRKPITNNNDHDHDHHLNS